jgi:tetratricopeptide (TPR) repeat protein
VLVGLSPPLHPPLHPPDRPLPDELAGASSHGYNCRCVARHFGLDPAAYGEVSACSLSGHAYRQLIEEAAGLQDEGKRLGNTRDIAAALRCYGRMRQIARQLDRTDLELAAVSDLAVVYYSAGDLRNARQCADAVLGVFKVITTAIVHFGQYTELRMAEGSREVAERVLISLSTEDNELERARTLIAGQRQRAAFRKAAEPGQFPPELLDLYGADELELRVMDVRVLVAAGDPAAAREELDEILAALQKLVQVDDVRDQAESLLVMARAERVRLRQGGGEAADARADLLRLSAQQGDTPARAKFDVQLAEAKAAAGDLPGAIAEIVAARGKLEAAGLPGDVAQASQALGLLLLSGGHIASAREQFAHAAELREQGGDPQSALRLELALAQCDAAEGRWESALRHSGRARDAAKASGAWLECLRADFAAATVLFAQGADPGQLLDLLLPVALAADEYRFRFTSAAARTAWAGSVAGLAMQQVMGLLAHLGDERLAAEMIERACAVGSFTAGGAPPLDLAGELVTLDVPATPAESGRLPLAALGSVTASLPLRLAPPPRLRWSPASPMRLDHWLGVAAERYGLTSPEGEPVPSWTAATGGRETFVMRFAEAGDTYLSWRSTDDPDQVRVAFLGRDLLESVRAELRAASPTPQEGESVEDAVGRSLAGSAFGSIEGERRLARLLALALLPAPLVESLRAAAAGGRRPLLRIQPSPSLAAVPWGLLALLDRLPESADDDVCFDTDQRVLDLADVSLLAPAGIPRRARAERSGPAVYILDPRIPGQSAFGELGSVLGRQQTSSPLVRHLDERLATESVLPSAASGLDLVRRGDVDRRRLAELLAEPCSRLVFAGHVGCVRDAHGAQTALHLSCSSELAGTAAPIGPHRPFTAADLALSEMDSMPPRVALIGCASASDFGLAEPFGVLLATVAAGAGLVAATVWALPTSAAVPGHDPMAELVIAVDTALAAEDPVGDLCAWQRASLDRWRASGEPALSPVFWASMTCLDATAPDQTWVR